MAWTPDSAYNYIFSSGLKNAFFAHNGGPVTSMDNSAKQKAMQFLNGNGISGPGSPVPDQLKAVPSSAWQKPATPPPANLGQYANVVRDPSGTPGVTNTRVDISPNAPSDVQQYVQNANQTNQILGGIGGLAPNQLIPGAANYSQPAPQPQQQQTQPVPSQSSGFDQLASNAQTQPPTLPTLPPPPAAQNQTGFNALTGGGASVQQPNLANVPATVTPPPAPTVGQPPAAPNAPQLPSPAGGTPGGGTMGDSGYVALLQQYQINNPNADLESPAVQDHFNEWAHNTYFVPHGVDNWNDLPTSAFPGFDAQAASDQVFTDQNYNQSQNATQTGQFQTGNTTAQNQQQTSGQATNQQQVGQSATSQAQNTTQNTNQQQTSGTTTGTTQDQTGTSTTQGTQTSGAVDTLGFGSLLQGAAGGAQTADATRQGFLTDLVDTGGANLNSQFDQGIRQALTGPQVTGAGDSARARMAGYAASDIARNNTNQRLAASQQLAGPTALTQLSTAANPFIGQTSTNTGTSATQGATTGTQNQSGFNNLVGSTNTASQGTSLTDTLNNMASSSSGFQNLASAGSENTAGTATGNSGSSARGLVPQAQQMSGGGGGCIICTVGIHHGLWKNKRILRKVVRHKLQTAYPRFRNAAAGYFTLFSPVVRLALRYPIVTGFTVPVAKAVVYEELRIAGRRLPFRVWPWVTHWSWHGLCSVAGRFVRRDGLQDETIIAVAKKHGVYFNIGGN